MAKSFTLQEIAEALDGHLIGESDQRITRLAHPADLRGDGDLALAMDPKLLPLLQESPNVPALVGGEESSSDFLSVRILVPRPRVALAKLTALFAEPVNVDAGVHSSAVVEKDAVIGSNAAIGALSYVGAGARIGKNAVLHPQVYIGANAVIGDDALIYPGVRIGAGTHIGDRVTIHFNASLGADGFSFVTAQAGSVEQAKAGTSGTVTTSNTHLMRIASLAPVILGDDIEIGANSSIDRGTIASTRIGSGTKIDNQVQVGHNVQIGENCMICGRVGIAGSAKIGHRVVLGGAVGVADHLTIGDDAIIMASSGVAGNVPPRAIFGGTPALPRERIMENIVNLGRLKQFFKKIEDLASRLDGLEKKNKND